MRPTRTQAIKTFLIASTKLDLASLYNHNMEVQVNVAQDAGSRIDGDFKGRQWHGYTDGFQIWKPIRIPYNANSEPEYVDVEITYDLAAHAEGIGMTGWDWSNKLSRWVAFDFDAISGHSDKHGKKMTDEELVKLREVVEGIEWVTLRRSTSGKGLHVYVFLLPVSTNNHNEHAALARAVLSKMSAVAGFDFAMRADIVGGNMWVWHRKMLGTSGLELLKVGTTLDAIPTNWRDHVKVVTGRRKMSLPKFIEDQESSVPGIEEKFTELTGQRVRVPLDQEHKRLLEWLDVRYPNASWWDSDNWMLVTHTTLLAEAHDELSMRGLFATVATGRDRGNDWNCFGGKTEVMTRQGPRTFKELAEIGHTELFVMTKEGMRWMTCKVRSFGKQKTYPIHFGDGHLYDCTADHRWIVRDLYRGSISQDKKFTYELALGKSQLPLADIELPAIDWEGYAHGFIFGDGWEQNTCGKLTTCVSLFKHDNDLKSLLCKFGNLGSHHYHGHGYMNEVHQLPAHWKSLPKIPTQSYALGFVLGLACADGFINSSSLKIFQSDPVVLDEVRQLALFAGLRTNPVRLRSETGGYENSRPGYALSINTYNLTAEHFLREDFKQNFVARTRASYTTVSNIGWDRGTEEEVFCAVVPFYENFTLANGVITSNCYTYPLKRGAWAVRRYSPGCAEHPLWIQDGAGWTLCYLNRLPDLKSVCRMFEAQEDSSGWYHFPNSEQAKKAALHLGADLDIPNWALVRKCKLKEHRSGRLVVELKHEADDPPIRGWLGEKSKWQKLFEVKASEPSEPEVVVYDDEVRHLITESGEDYGWVVYSDGIWHSEPYQNVKCYLSARGHSGAEATNILGSSVARHWTMVNLPFEPEYPKDRRWNRGAAQLRYKPIINRDDLKYGTWLGMLGHLGQSLDDAIKQSAWASSNGVLTGADYLKCWVSSLFKYPCEPLPYLFFYGPQDSGKSIFHEALQLLVLPPTVVVRADTALTSQSNFNGELENSILAVIEETDLQRNRSAYNRIKDWVTSLYLPIHKKQRQPYTVKNTTHWIQCANSNLACPVFVGDTRITMCYVPELAPSIKVPKREFLRLLEEEAADFMTEILNLELPPSNDRLNVPVIRTEDKALAEEANQTFLEIFLKEKTHHVDGKRIAFSDLYERFTEWLDPNYVRDWSKIRFGREMPPRHPKGRLPATGQFWYGNISWEPRGPGEPILPKLVVKDGKLIASEETNNEQGA